MRIRLIYFVILCLGTSSFLVLISATPDPERQILGEWKEVKWEYEKVDLTGDDGTALLHIPDDVKASIGQHLVIHQAETWTFLPDGRLRLKSDTVDKEVTWRMKGRGHILQIKYDRNNIENYVVDKLKDGTLWLQFETDIQARGIARLVFEKS
jgi:hypothetical protein